jgi:hypothetical protein
VRRFVWSLAASLTLMFSQHAVALGSHPEDVSQYTTCGMVDSSVTSVGAAPQSSGIEFAIPERVDPPGLIPPNAGWPIVSSSVSSSVSGTGRPVTIVVEIREAPRAASTADVPAGRGSGSGARMASPLAVPVACSFNASLSVDVHAYMGAAFSQNFSVYFNRWCIIESCGLFGYVVTQTQIWFTRSDPSYDLSGQSLNWWMTVRDCNNITDPRSIGNQPGIPAWFGNETQHWWYYSPMNSWPVLWSDLYEGYSSYVTQGSDVTEDGYWAGHLSSSWIFPKS